MEKSKKIEELLGYMETKNPEELRKGFTAVKAFCLDPQNHQGESMVDKAMLTGLDFLQQAGAILGD